MKRIVLKHVSGSKANQVEEFPLSHFTELVIGRDPEATVRFDPDRDDLVGRKHARIIVDGTIGVDGAAGQFTVVDLNSRNGTFVNRQRVTSAMRLRPGDHVQFGADGPAFVFDVEPRPDGSTPPTREAGANGAARGAPPPTRTGAPPPAPSAGPPAGAPAPVGKATVERLIHFTRTESRRSLIAAAGALIAVVAAVAAWQVFSFNRQIGEVAAGGETTKKGLAELDKRVAPMPPNDIARNYGKAVVKIDVVWRLVSPDGRQVFHQYMPNRDPEGKPYIPNGQQHIPWYVQLPDGTVEPYLTYDGNKESRVIGSAHTGSGFVVSNDGFILTNRHVAAAWKTRYELPEDALVGLVFKADKKTLLRPINLREEEVNWVPAQTRQEFKGSFDGRNDRLEVAFPGNDTPTIAQLSRVSNAHDVALIKVNLPEPVPDVKLYDNYDAAQLGDGLTVMGYPGVTPPVLGFLQSQDPFNRKTQAIDIPNLTVTPASIGAILRGKEAAGKSVVSYMGDSYQLTTNATGSGNSGGPVFDDRGRVIGIFFAGRRTANAAVTYAIPIRWGLKLMGIEK